MDGLHSSSYFHFNYSLFQSNFLYIVPRSFYWCIHAILNACESSSYNLFMSSLKCNVLCIDINFLFLWSISLSSSFVHFINGSEYLTRDTAQLFDYLMEFTFNMFTVKVWLPTFNSILQFSMTFGMKFLIFSGILYIFKRSIIHVHRTIS